MSAIIRIILTDHLSRQMLTAIEPNEAVEWSYCLPITEDDIVPGTDTSCNCYNSQHGGDVSECKYS